MTIPSLEEFIKSEKDSIQEQIVNYSGKQSRYVKGYDDGKIAAYNRILNYIEYVRTEGE